MRQAIPAALLIVACGDAGAPSANVEVPLPAELETFDGELASVIESASRAVEEEPDAAARWMELGMVYEAHSMHDYALPCYRRASELAPEDPKAAYRLGIAAMNHGDAALAEEALGRTVELAPEYVPARRRLGRWWLELGETDAARAQFDAALAVDPGDASSALGLAQVLLEEDRPQEAIDALRDPIFSRGALAALAHRVRGLAMVRLGHSDALAELERGKGARPGGGDPWSREVAERKVGESALLMRAGRLIDRGQAQAGVELLEELLTRSDEDARVYRRLAKGYAALTRWSDSAQALTRAAELEPEDAELFVGIAAARLQGEDRLAALEALRGALAIDPAHATANETLVQLLIEERRHAEVRAAAAAARGAGLESAELEQLVGKAELDAGEIEAAHAAFARATQLDPTNVDGWIGLALTALEVDTEDAAAALARARALDEDHPMIATIAARLEEGAHGDR